MLLNSDQQFVFIEDEAQLPELFTEIERSVCSMHS